MAVIIHTNAFLNILILFIKNIGTSDSLPENKVLQSPGATWGDISTVFKFSICKMSQ